MSVSIQQPPNTFFDVHYLVGDVSSLLHDNVLPNCSLQCKQVYKSGGQEIGSFVIEFSFVRSEAIDPQGATVPVTRVSVNKM